ncbi:hypothetical protein GW17_00015147 [Ensete ventricosum]|nr:hypothetical protein GW17_00015147 [Ensete ventricosum]
MRWDLAGSSLGDSLKESGSLLETRREIAGKKTGELIARLSEVVRITSDGQQLTAGKLPRTIGRNRPRGESDHQPHHGRLVLDPMTRSPVSPL